MLRFLFYIFIAYVVFFILKLIFKSFRNSSNGPRVRRTSGTKSVNRKEYDKDKAVDADFEDLQ